MNNQLYLYGFWATLLYWIGIINDCKRCDGQGWWIYSPDGITPEQVFCEDCIGTGYTI